MIQSFPTILRSSERCCGPVVGSTGDVRLSFANRAADFLNDMKRADVNRHKGINPALGTAGFKLGNSLNSSISNSSVINNSAVFYSAFNGVTATRIT